QRPGARTRRARLARGSNLRIALRWFGGIDPVLFERDVEEVFALGPEVLVTGTAQWRRCGGEQARSRLCSRTSPTRSARLVQSLAHPGGGTRQFWLNDLAASTLYRAHRADGITPRREEGSCPVRSDAAIPIAR